MTAARRLAIVILAVAAAGVGRVASTASAWTDAPSLGSNTVATATLQPPGGPTATASCDGLNKAKIVLGWTAATLADGYDIDRSAGNANDFSFLTHVDGGSTLSYTNGSLATNTAYYYRLRSTRSNWSSTNSATVSATTPVLCL